MLLLFLLPEDRNRGGLDISLLVLIIIIIIVAVVEGF
jgi:hypothetical protein